MQLNTGNALTWHVTLSLNILLFNIVSIILTHDTTFSQ